MRTANSTSQDNFYQALERYQPYLTASDYSALIDLSNQPAPLSVRANLLKVKHPREFFKNLAGSQKWETKILPYYAQGLQLLSYDTPPSQTTEYRLGYFYIQDAASIFPVTLFDQPQKGSLTLDLAASPGGKTTQLIDSVVDQDFVIANDSSSSRLSALRTVLQTWGASNYAITNFNGEKFGDWFPNTFDRVLLDAPCSMESLRVSASHPHREITTDERARLTDRQLALLISAFKSAKPGAEIVYSTCTLAPEEDESVLDQFIHLYADMAEINGSAAKRYAISALPSFENVDFEPSVRNGLRLWPFVFNTNGFFAAKILKTDETKESTTQSPSRDFRLTGFTQLDSSDLKLVKLYFKSIYQFDLEEILEAGSKFGLMKRNDRIHLIPMAFFNKFSNLPYHAFGMPLGRLIKGNLELSFDLVNRFGDGFSGNYWVMPEDMIKSWLRGNDIRGLNLPEVQPSSVVAIRSPKGLNLGAGKYSPGRLRNLLPNRNLFFL